MAADEVLLVISTFPDAEKAARIARELVEARLAACANLLPAVRSIYRWQEKIEDSTETMVFFKIARPSCAEFQAKLKALHPYDVPEIIALPIAEGWPDYLRWVSENSLPPTRA